MDYRHATEAATNPALSVYPRPQANVFLMMRFGGPSERPVLDAVRPALSRYGLSMLRADKRSFADTLWGNVRVHMDASDLGIAIFDRGDVSVFNPNVSLEVGYMLAQGKPVLLLKEKQLSALPTDLIGHLYKEYRAADPHGTVPALVHQWLIDIGLAKGPGERRVLFVSYGGSCRCAMAKVIARRLWDGRALPYGLRIESVAYTYGDANEATGAARDVVRDHFGADLLRDHKVTKQSPGVLADADLILVMEEGLSEGMPPEKTFLFNEFFGGSGDVPNTWPDDGSPESEERYRNCFHSLLETLQGEEDRIFRYLSSVG